MHPNEDLDMALRAVVRKAIMLSGRTDAEIAKALGTTESYVRNLHLSKKAVGVEEARRVVSLLGFNVTVHLDVRLERQTATRTDEGENHAES